jgi:acyl-CoA synthetase (AMP-forming)/AMP-acid ligase II
MQVEAGALVRQTAERFGDRTALTSQARTLSFADLNAAANRVGSAVLELGARRGDRVGVLAYNTPEVVEAWFGFEKHNLVRAVLHSHFPMDAHVASLNHIQASTLIFDTRFAEQVDAARGELTSVRHLVAVGRIPPTGPRRSPTWRLAVTPRTRIWTWTRTPPVSYNSPRAPPASPRPG